MAKYEYEVCELKEVDVPPCPLCGSDNLHFWSHNHEYDRIGRRWSEVHGVWP